MLTRRQRADRVKRQQAAFFHYYQPEAQEILRDLLEEYASDGELQFALPDVLKLPPIFHHGNVNETIGNFGGADQFRNAITAFGSDGAQLKGRTFRFRDPLNKGRRFIPLRLDVAPLSSSKMQTAKVLTSE